ncbi:MAG TPA: hypothetical protein VGF94_07495 [Kofleriaceae bacterium]|jgi:hypothetical protein
MTATVTAKLAGTKPARPPILTLLVDVDVVNTGSAARWALISSRLPVEAGGVDKLEQLTAGATAIGRFLGTGGRYAVRLAPGAHVVLKNVEVQWWRGDAPAKTVALEVQLAADAKIGIQPMATWFTGDPTISGTVTVDLQAAKHTASHRAPDDAEQPIELAGASATQVELAVP